ncbi:FAD-dependent monooxygenase [Amycolatopsis endophytica]
MAGCDGGHSAVRRLAGIGFPGTDPEPTGYQAVADIDGAEQLADGWTWSARGAYRYGPQPGRVATVEFDGGPADRSAPVTLDEVQSSLRRVSGADVTLTALRATPTRWTDNTRQAAAYRAGRVFLAGDAAHVHPPFGGQGLNLGVGDAMNLGWKLGAVIAGWASEGLLGTYETERRPIGRGCWTGRGPRSGCCAAMRNRPGCARSWPICWPPGTARRTPSRRSSGSAGASTCPAATR